MTGTSEQPDFSQQVLNLDTNALIKLVALAEQQMAMRKNQDLRIAYEKYMEIAKQLNVSMEEIIAAGQTKPGKTKKSVEVKYANPQNPNETWTGRGKHPRWLATQLAAGKPLTDFLIVKAE